jgi:prolipoprotein diacylglyceryltransferase
MAAFDRGKGLAKGFFWGGLIGVVIGILITTRRDKGTWEEIGKSADALADKTKEQIGQARIKLAEMADRGKDSYAGEQESPKETGAPQA